MDLDKNMNGAINKQVRKALVVDEDRDRYHRKERTDSLKQAGFKVYPVLRMQDARGRCKPGAFDVIVVNAGENAGMAVELCDAIKGSGGNQQLFLVAGSQSELPARDYVVSSWDDLMKELHKGEKNKERAAA